MAMECPGFGCTMKYATRYDNVVLNSSAIEVIPSRLNLHQAEITIRQTIQQRRWRR